MKTTIVIGAARKDWLPAKVCEFTIRENLGSQIRFIHTFDLKFRRPEKPENADRTGFSYVRFAVPALCGFKGRAIYFDSDMLLFRDVKELVELPFRRAAVLRPREQTAVLVYDCERLKHWVLEDFISKLDSGEWNYHQFMELGFEPLVANKIPKEWNQLEQYTAGTTALLHYTNLTTQPWLKSGNRLESLWHEKLRQACIEGFIDPEDVKRETHFGHVIRQVYDVVADLEKSSA